MQLKAQKKQGSGSWDYVSTKQSTASHYSQTVSQANALLNHARPQWMREKLQTGFEMQTVPHRAINTGQPGLEPLLIYWSHISESSDRRAKHEWVSLIKSNTLGVTFCVFSSMWVPLSYPGGHRKSRVAPACCSTWPRTRRSWWGWRPPSPRPASPHRRPACASCSVCRGRNVNSERHAALGRPVCDVHDSTD